MTANPSMSRWLARVVLVLVLLYALWWVADLEAHVLTLIKIMMESLLPQIFSVVQSVAHTSEGGWKSTTTIHPVADASAFLAFGIAPVFLKKCVFWIPAALALVSASAMAKPKKISLAITISLLTAVALTAICVGAHLAITINGTPAMLDDDILPGPPDFKLNAAPYSTWYFHLVTFASYLGILIAPLAMPVIIWFVTCAKEIRLMLSNEKRTQSSARTTVS